MYCLLSIPIFFFLFLKHRVEKDEGEEKLDIFTKHILLQHVKFLT